MDFGEFYFHALRRIEVKDSTESTKVP